MRVFLSYSSHQRDLAERVAVALRSEGHEVFFDRDTMGAGDAFHKKIRGEVRRSHVMVFLISPRAVEADSFARTELRIAEREWKSPAARVVGVMAEPTPMEDVPAFLREVTMAEVGRNVVSEVSYAIDRLSRARRSRIVRAIAVVGVVAGLGAGIVWVAMQGDDGKTVAAGEVALPAKIVEKKQASQPSKPTTVVRLGDGVMMRMVSIEGGTFTMGSLKSESGHNDDERQHEATVSDFWIGRTEVTQAQWNAVMGTSPSNCDYGCGPEYPVNKVSWEDAITFTNALSRKLELRECYRQEGEEWVFARDCNGFRLPTEAEWEYAARAGTTTAYSFGDSSADLCAYGNFADSSAKAAHSDWPWASDICDDVHANLARFGTFSANPWGLLDMHGNVLEWAWDWYGPYPEGGVVDHRGPSKGDARVLRGGSFEFFPQGLRSAYRSRLLPAVSDENHGLRCVRAVPAEP